MPKTSVYKNDFTPGWKHQIGLARQAADMEPITISHAMYKAANHNLRFGVLAAHQGHPRAAFLRGKRVHSPVLLHNLRGSRQVGPQDQERFDLWSAAGEA